MRIASNTSHVVVLAANSGLDATSSLLPVERRLHQVLPTHHRRMPAFRVWLRDGRSALAFLARPHTHTLPPTGFVSILSALWTLEDLTRAKISILDSNSRYVFPSRSSRACLVYISYSYMVPELPPHPYARMLVVTGCSWSTRPESCLPAARRWGCS